MPRSRQSALIARSASSLKTAPLGLFGDTVTIARVRSVIAARSASSRG